MVNLMINYRLVGLTDLNTGQFLFLILEKANVQQRIADYLTDLIGIGFSGNKYLIKDLELMLLNTFPQKDYQKY
jgi:hypothetical protein